MISSSEKRYKGSYLFILCTVAFLFLINKIRDLDIWYHLSLGRYIYENISRFPSLKEPLIHPLHDQTGYFQSWLFEVTVYFVNLLSGLPGLVFLNAAIGAFTVLFLYKASIANGSSGEASALSVFTFLPLMSLRFIIRPEISLYLSMSIVIYILALYVNGKRNHLFLIPLIQIFSMNLHPSGLVILLLLVFFTSSEIVKGVMKVDLASRRRILPLSAIILLTVVASAFNPYGMDTTLAPIRFALDAVYAPQPAIIQNVRSTGQAVQTAVTEMMPIYKLGGIYMKIYVLYVALIIGSFIVSMRKGMFNITHFSIFLFFALLPIKSVRTIGMLPIIAIPIFARNISETLRFGFRCVAAAGLLLLLILKVINYRDVGLGLEGEAFPVKACDFLLRDEVKGNMFNSFDMGGYIGWRLYPGYKVFVDGRAPGSLMTEERMVYDMVGSWRDILDKYRIDFIVTNSSYLNDSQRYKLIDNLFFDKGWVLVYQDENSLIFVRDGTNEALIERYALPKKRIWEEVISEASYHISRDPKKEKAWESLGYAYSMQGRWADAVRAYKNGLKYHPENEVMRKNIEIFRSMGYNN